MVTFSYGRNWSGAESRFGDVISEEDARARFAGDIEAPDDWFSVAAWRDGDPETGPVEYVLEVLPHGTYVNVEFYDLDRRLALVFGFRQHGDRLFREEIVEYTYPADGRYFMLLDASVVETSTYTPEGLVHVTTDDTSKPTVSEEDYRNVDVSEHWEPIPEFGHWESLGRYRRS